MRVLNQNFKVLFFLIFLFFVFSKFIFCKEIPLEIPCYQIKEIKITSSKLLHKKIKKITAPYIGSCLKPKELENILRLINNLYTEKGYITTRAFIQPQNIASGILEVAVVEGRVEEIVFDEMSQSHFLIFDKTQIFSGFPNQKNSVLNLRDIEQFVSQMNHLPSNNITMKILPGDKKGYSKIILNNSGVKSNVRLKTSVDNSGQQSTGLYNARISTEQDNIFKINDLWNITYSQSLREKTSDKQSKSFVINLNLPVGYWDISANFVKSEYATVIFGTNDKIRNSGTGLQHSYKLSHSIYRGKNQTFGAWAQLNLKDNRSFIEDTQNEVASRKLTILKAGTSYNCTTFLGYFDFNLGYRRGMNFLEAKEDDSFTNNFTPRVQFQKLDLNVTYYKPFRIKKNNFYFKSFFSGQYALDPLFSSEQMVIGDPCSVRGYRENSAFGDHGFFSNNEVAFFVPGFLSEKFGINRILRKSELFAGFDIGKVQHFGGPEANSNQGKAALSGYSVGVRFKGRLNLECTYSKSVNTVDFIGSSEEIYLNAGYQFF